MFFFWKVLFTAKCSRFWSIGQPNHIERAIPGVQNLFFRTTQAMTERQQQDDLAGAFLQQLESQKSQETSLGSLLCKRKLLGLEKRIKALEKEVEKLSKQQNYSDEIMIDICLDNQISDGISEITLRFHLAALIPPSIAELERSFSLMKLSPMSLVPGKPCSVRGYLEHLIIIGARLSTNISGLDHGDISMVGWMSSQSNLASVKLLVVYRSKC